MYGINTLGFLSCHHNGKVDGRPSLPVPEQLDITSHAHDPDRKAQRRRWKGQGEHQDGHPEPGVLPSVRLQRHAAWGISTESQGMVKRRECVLVR